MKAISYGVQACGYVVALLSGYMAFQLDEADKLFLPTIAIMCLGAFVVFGTIELEYRQERKAKIEKYEVGQ